MTFKSFEKNIKKVIFFSFIIFIYFYFFNASINATSINTKEEELKSSLYCNNDIIMDLESGNIIFEKNAHSKVYPASTTKVLTALLAIENLNLDDTVVVSKNAVYSTPIGSSIMYLKPEEVISIKNLLYGLLLHSGNDAANALAEAVSGNIPDFINLMNLKLKEIGCNDTHFTNTHGFHDSNHYTTVFDMAKLFRYAVQNETFKEIIATKEITIPKTNKTEERTYKNTNKMFNPKYTKMYYEYVIGGKTGYTEEARGTFVGYGKKDDKTVIVCAFDGSQNISGNEGRFLDSIQLFEYAFNNFNKYNLLDKNDFTFCINDESYNKKYTFSIKDDMYALYNNDFHFSRYTLNLTQNDLESYNLNDKVGTLTVSTNGNSVDVTNTLDLILVSKENYFNASSNIKLYINIILCILCIVIILFTFKNYFKKSKKKIRKTNTKMQRRNYNI
mgnify:FL=1